MILTRAARGSHTKQHKSELNALRGSPLITDKTDHRAFAPQNTQNTVRHYNRTKATESKRCRHLLVQSMWTELRKRTTGYGQIPDTGSCEILHHPSPWWCLLSRETAQWSPDPQRRKDAGPAACPVQKLRVCSAQKGRGTFERDGFCQWRRATGTLHQSSPPPGSQTHNLRGGERESLKKKGTRECNFLIV